VYDDPQGLKDIEIVNFPPGMAIAVDDRNDHHSAIWIQSHNVVPVKDWNPENNGKYLEDSTLENLRSRLDRLHTDYFDTMDKIQERVKRNDWIVLTARNSVGIRYARRMSIPSVPESIRHVDNRDNAERDREASPSRSSSPPRQFSGPNFRDAIFDTRYPKNSEERFCQLLIDCNLLYDLFWDYPNRSEEFMTERLQKLFVNPRGRLVITSGVRKELEKHHHKPGWQEGVHAVRRWLDQAANLTPSIQSLSPGLNLVTKASNSEEYEPLIKIEKDHFGDNDVTVDHMIMVTARQRKAHLQQHDERDRIPYRNERQEIKWGPAVGVLTNDQKLFQDCVDAGVPVLLAHVEPNSYFAKQAPDIRTFMSIFNQETGTNMTYTEAFHRFGESPETAQKWARRMLR